MDSKKISSCVWLWKAHPVTSGGPFLVPTVYPLALFRLRQHTFLFKTVNSHPFIKPMALLRVENPFTSN